MKKVIYNGLTFRPYIEAARIAQRVKEIARDITTDYSESVPLMICVLNGAFLFASDLFRSLAIDAEIEFVRLKSYDGTGSTGKIKELIGLTEDISGRDVIIIEDIVDTGLTIENLVNEIKSKNPASVKVASLLFKPEALKGSVTPDYVGFDIPSKFIIGYGLDIDGMARNLPDIWILDDQFDS